jgi:hypothetical protein
MPTAKNVRRCAGTVRICVENVQRCAENVGKTCDCEFGRKVLHTGRRKSKGLARGHLYEEHTRRLFMRVRKNVRASLIPYLLSHVVRAVLKHDLIIRSDRYAKVGTIHLLLRAARQGHGKVMARLWQGYGKVMGRLWEGYGKAKQAHTKVTLGMYTYGCNCLLLDTAIGTYSKE